MIYLIAIIALIGILIYFYKKKKTQKAIQPFVSGFDQVLTENELILISLINSYRDKNDLPVLHLDNTHCQLAQTRVNYCLEVGVITHDYFFKHNKILTDQRVSCAENLAMAYSSPKSILNAWKNSKGHNENLLFPHWEYVGVSIKKGANHRDFVCLILGRKI